MLSWILIICATAGGTVLVCQFVLMLLGVVDLGVEVPDDMPDGGDVSLADGHDSIFGVLSFRSVTAALTFFGIAGLAAESANAGPVLTLLIATAAGFASMYGVYYLMLSMARLGHDRTTRIERAIGKPGTVYLPIPAGGAGAGKVHLRWASGVSEFAAVTSGPNKLPAGAKVVVVRVVDGGTVEVEPAPEAKPDAA